jgi:hypothetical protein
MPYNSEWVAPDRFLTHKGVKIYHIYKDDDVNNGTRSEWYTWDPAEGSDDGTYSFDVRDLPTYDEAKTILHLPPEPPYPKDMPTDSPAYHRQQKARKKWQDAAWKLQDPIRRKAIELAIDKGLLTQKGLRDSPETSCPNCRGG